MIGPDDLKASVAAGILTERQAASLTALAHSRRGAREGLQPGDEPFELFRGFNEIFIIIGLIILATGAIGVFGFIATLYLSSGIQTVIAWQCAISCVGLWLLSEYFVVRRRMVGPAIALTIMFIGCATFGLSQYFSQPFMLAQNRYDSLLLPGVLSIAAAFVYWFRFRVPFAMALIALAMFGVALLIVAVQSGTPRSVQELFLLSGSGGFAWITLALGLGVFAVAMMFDASDPHRVTRRSANGFWLHVVAAPAIVNTVAMSLLSSDTNEATGLLLAFLLGIAIVAILIDRRSFLIAAAGYIVTIAATALRDEGIFVLILSIGVLMLLLGAFWEKIRAALLAIMPRSFPRRYLPPST